MEYKVNRYQLLPVSLLIIAGLLIFVFFAGNKAIDIQFHSTYFVIPYIHFVYYSLVGYGLYGLIYWFYRNSKRRLLWRLSMIHLTLSVIGALIFLIMLAITDEFVSKGSWLGLDMELSYLPVIAMLTGLVCVGLGPVLFSINLVVAIVFSLTKNQ